MCATGGLYAPTIRHHEGIFYVVCTNVIHVDENDGTHQNFIVSTTDIWGDQWSDPVFFDFDGIDTSIIWDSDGRSYMHGSAAPGPMTTIKAIRNRSQYGKEAHRMRKIIWRGTGGIWPEGPHIYGKDDGWFYLLISEALSEDHMITVRTLLKIHLRPVRSKLPIIQFSQLAAQTSTYTTPVTVISFRMCK